MECGNKYKYLKVMQEKNILVPKFSALGYSFFIKVLNAVGAMDTIRVLTIQNNVVIDKFRDIRKCILEETIPMELEDEIMNKTIGLTFPIAVRSSASIEDSTTRSSAGQFLTTLNVTPKEVVNCVRATIASLYDEKAAMTAKCQNFSPQAYFMGVVFQEMVNPQYSGVLFTADPITGDSSSRLVEIIEGYGEKLVLGIGKSEKIQLPKFGKITGCNKEKESLFYKLNELSNALENKVGTNLDIEWAYKDESLYALQCRPITTIDPKPIIDEVKIISIADLDESIYLLLGYLQKRYKKWLKKAKIFKVCEHNKIRIHKWKLCIFNKSQFEDMNLNNIISNYDSKVVLYSFNGNTSFCENISEAQKRISEFVNLVDDNSYCISILTIYD